MSKKTFSFAAWLLIACGGLVIAAVVLSKRTVMPWQRPPVPLPLVTIKNVGKWGIGNITFSPDGKRLIHEGAVLEQWDVNTGKRVAVPNTLQLPLPARRTQRTRWCVGISANGKVAAVQRLGVLSRTVPYVYSFPKWVTTKVPDGKGGYKPGTMFKERKVTLPRQLFRAKGIDLFNIQAGALIGRVPLPNDEPGQSHFPAYSDLILSPEGSHVLVVEEFRIPDEIGRWYKSQLWDAKSQQLVWEKRGRRTPWGDRNPQLFFIDRKTVALAETLFGKNHWPTGELRLLNHRTDTVINDYKALSFEENHGYIRWGPVVVSPDGRYLAAAYWTGFVDTYSHYPNGLLHVWDVRTRRLLWTAREDNVRPRTFQFSPDSETLAVGYSDDTTSRPKGKLLLWDVQTGALKTKLTEETQQDQLKQIKIIQKDKVDSTLRKLSGQKIPVGHTQYLPGDSGSVVRLSFSPDGKLLAAGYGNGSIKTWKVK